MVSGMETIGPNSDPGSAAADLEAVADARRAVRDRPWPAWLYPVNAALLAALVLTALVRSSAVAAVLAVVIGAGLAAINYAVGRAMGTPFAVPTSRAFRLLVALAAVLVIASLFVPPTGSGWWLVGFAAGAAASYGIGAVIHYRSTHP